VHRRFDLHLGLGRLAQVDDGLAPQHIGRLGEQAVQFDEAMRAGFIAHTEAKSAVQVSDEPVPGFIRGARQGARLLEQVGRARHDDQFRVATHLRQGASVEGQHFVIVAADDQQCGRLDAREIGSR
jgi:hypothetical protein